MNRPASWQHLIDSRLGLIKLQLPSETYERARLASAFAGQVPACVVCEDLYTKYLLDEFGIDAGCIRDRSENTDPHDETIFAVGRSILIGINVNYQHYTDFCFHKTCLSLHDMSIDSAADGLLSLVCIRKLHGKSYSPAGERFLLQTISYLFLILSIFPSTETLAIVNKSKYLLEKSK